MNLAVIIPSLEKYGGAERLVVECLSRWQHRHDITLYATAVNDDLLKEHGITDVRCVVLSDYFEGEHGFLLNAVLLPKIWRREIGRHDLYHTHLWPTHQIDLHPMVWYPHEPVRALHDLRFENSIDAAGDRKDVHIYPKFAYDSVDPGAYGAYLDAIDGADRAVRPERIIANSKYCAAYLSEVYGRPVTDVVYPGAQTIRRPALKRDPGLFVTISQLWSHKRVRILIEAIALTDGTQLLIMGSGPEKDRLQDLVIRLGLEDRVFFLSGLSNSELALVLARACAFLFCPIKEPFGIVVVEAMNAGLPVIAVAEGGYLECCTEDTAFLVPPFPSAFAEKIAFLQANPDVAERMGRAARERAALFTWDRTSGELEAILVQTAQAHAPADRPNLDEKRTLFGIQYYLWYGEGFGAAHWNDTSRSGHVSDRPLIGYYGSANGETIQFHLGLFEQMDLDYAILNLHVDEHGLNSVEVQSIQHVFEVAERRGTKMRFAVQLAPYTDHLPTIEQAVAQVGRNFAASPLYFRLADKPVLFWFWSSAFDRRKDMIAAISGMTKSFRNLAVSLRLPDAVSERDLTFGLFEGFVPFSPLELCAEDNWQPVWDSGYAAADRAGMQLRMATVSPGYDDHALDDPRRVDNRLRRVPRRNGATYATSIAWLEGLRIPPHLAIVSTFNELHENTHIEPTVRNGMRYIDMTKDFIARMKQAQRRAANAG